jgi:hypothetical protein
VLARRLLDELRETATRPWRIMKVCGGQTHTLVRQGIDELPPAGMRMIHGPGGPVWAAPGRYPSPYRGGTRPHCAPAPGDDEPAGQPEATSHPARTVLAGW